MSNQLSIILLHRKLHCTDIAHLSIHVHGIKRRKASPLRIILRPHNARDNKMLQYWARILVHVTIYRRLLIGRDDHIDQS